MHGYQVRNRRHVILLYKVDVNLDDLPLQLRYTYCRCPVERTGTSWIIRASPEEIRADVDFALEQVLLISRTARRDATADYRAYPFYSWERTTSTL